MFDSSMTAAAIADKVADLQKAAGITTQLVNPNGRGTSFITLTGWVALAALAALFIVVAGEFYPSCSLGTDLALLQHYYRNISILSKPLGVDVSKRPTCCRVDKLWAAEVGWS